MASINLDLDFDEAVEKFNQDAEDIDESAEDIIDQLSVLAEGAMKAEAPEGTGSLNEHLKSTIKATRKSETKAVIQPHKRTRDGWYLHHAIVGNPSVPSYGDVPPPVWSDGSGEAQGPLADWAAAKLGDNNAAWKMAQTIQQRGQRTYPNRFIDRSIEQWSAQVEDIAETNINEALE